MNIIFFILKIPRKLQAPTGLYTASHKRNLADQTQNTTDDDC